METIKKRLSFTSMVAYFDDVNDAKFLGRITEGFDDGEVYETSEVSSESILKNHTQTTIAQGEFIRKAEIIFSANCFGMDEDTGKVDEERVLDRIGAIPFSEWEDVPAAEFASMQKRFKEVVDNPEKPTEFLIGEIGQFLRSDEFMVKRDEFAGLLYEKTEECIKMRTLSTNYSSFYAILWKFHDVFHSVWNEMGSSWDEFLSWVESVHAPFLMQQHKEKDHAKHSIRRYVLDLLSLILLWSIIDRRKVLKICETKKLKMVRSIALPFTPAQGIILCCM